MEGNLPETHRFGTIHSLADEKVPSLRRAAMKSSICAQGDLRTCESTNSAIQLSHLASAIHWTHKFLSGCHVVADVLPYEVEWLMQAITDSESVTCAG